MGLHLWCILSLINRIILLKQHNLMSRKRKMMTKSPFSKRMCSIISKCRMSNFKSQSCFWIAKKKSNKSMLTEQIWTQVNSEFPQKNLNRWRSLTLCMVVRLQRRKWKKWNKRKNRSKWILTWKRKRGPWSHKSSELLLLVQWVC